MFGFVNQVHILFTRFHFEHSNEYMYGNVRKENPFYNFQKFGQCFHLQFFFSSFMTPSFLSHTKTQPFVYISITQAVFFRFDDIYGL